MRRLMELMVFVALMGVMVVGCAGTPAADRNTTQNGTPPAAEAGAPEQESQETEWPRTYVDALGREIVLEKKPEKVALLFFRNFEHLFLLGEPPVPGGPGGNTDFVSI